MTSCTFKEYKKNYKSNLSAYLEKLDDNTVKSFFSEELEDYKAYHQALVNLKELILPYFEDDSIPVEVDTHQVADLKIINENAYSQFITDEDNTRYLDLIDGKWKDVGPEDSSLIDFDKLKNFIKSSDRIIDFITVQLEKSKLSVNLDFTTSADDSSSKKVETDKSKNPYPQIFSSGEAFLFFDTLFHIFKNSPFLIADFSFIYRMMYQDDLILDNIKNKAFMNWLNREPYEISLDKIKTINNCFTIDKLNIYNTLKKTIPFK